MAAKLERAERRIESGSGKFAMRPCRLEESPRRWYRPGRKGSRVLIRDQEASSRRTTQVVVRDQGTPN